MKKKTFNLDELRFILPILDKQEQMGIIGGCSRAEYLQMVVLGTWNGGDVENIGYVGINDNVTWGMDGSFTVGSGTESSPYTAFTYSCWSGYWPGGYVDGMGYVSSCFINNDYPTQTYNGTCVPTVMAYAAAMFGEGYYSEGYFISKYNEIYGTYDVNNGIPSNQLTSLVGTSFNYSILNNDLQSLCTSLDDKKPVMGSVQSGDSWHEILITGYKEVDGMMYFNCINPGTGKTENHSYREFVGSLIKLDSMK